MEKFYKDLKEGQTGEKAIANFLNDNGYEVLRYNNDKLWDIIALNASNKPVLFEVKTDRYELYKGKTGNMFIETSCGGKPSGVSSTEADWFIYYLPDFNEAYFIKTKELKKHLLIEGFRYATRSGDNGKVRGHLINREKYSHLFHIHKVDSKYFNP
jgi:hypothetical protein